MKTQLTKDIEKCALKELAKMGTFICPECGINIRRFGFSKRYYRTCKLTEQEMIDRGWKPSWHTDTEIVDLLSWESNKNIWKCFEIKVTYQDFKSNASKTFVGNYNYYIVPDTLLDKIKNEVPPGIGIYVYETTPNEYRWHTYLSCYKRAKKQELGCTQDEIYYGMIKSLYREVNKYKKVD